MRGVFVYSFLLLLLMSVLLMLFPGGGGGGGGGVRGGESLSTKQIIFIKYGSNALQFRLTLTVKVYTQVQRTRLTALPSSQAADVTWLVLGF